MAKAEMQWVTVKGKHIPVSTLDVDKKSASNTKSSNADASSTQSASAGISGKKQVQKKFDKLNVQKGPKASKKR